MSSDFIGPVKKRGYKPPKKKKSLADLSSGLDHKTKVRLSYFYISLLYIIISLFLLAAIAFAVISPFRETLYQVFGTSEPYFQSDLISVYKGSNVANGILSSAQVSAPMENSQFALLYSQKLNINAPVYCGTSDRVLSNGVGFNPESSVPGLNSNTYLVGNCNYLAGLENVSKGDIFIFTTNYGYFKYKVYNTEVIAVEESDKIDTSEGSENLIIQSQYPFGELNDARYQVLRVYASKVSGPSVTY